VIGAAVEPGEVGGTGKDPGLDPGAVEELVVPRATGQCQEKSPGKSQPPAAGNPDLGHKDTQAVYLPFIVTT